MTAVAPDFELPSIDAGPVRLSDLLTRSGRVLLLFVHGDCPTSLLALDRLGPLASKLEHRGLPLVVVAQETTEAAARLACRHGVLATVLADAAPHDVSAAFAVDVVPTALLVGDAGAVIGRAVGWSAEAFQELLPVPVPDGEPRWKPGCGSRTVEGYETPATDELEEMFELGWTDGLPVVPPTPERVEAMLGGRDPCVSLGEVPPAMGEATLERVASCAVLAGCRPQYFPVVLAAVRALLDPAYNLNGLTVTTSPPGQVLVVNGPVRGVIGLNSGMGALGPGARANLTIGRAVRLVATLTGGGAPGRLDRSTLGHPGKLSFCVAENEEASPWEPLHVERGFPAEASTVTLLAGDAPLSISDHRSRSPEALAVTLGWAAAGQWSPFWWPLDSVSLFVICPEHAALFGEAGWTKRDLRRAIFESVRRPAGELKRGETTPAVLAAGVGDSITKWTSPDRIMIIVAGGEAGRFSAVIGPSLSMDTTVLTREVEWTT